MLVVLNWRVTDADAPHVGPLRRSCCRRCQSATASDDGFTIVEMVIAISISAIIFMALAFTLGSALTGLGAQKTRIRANDLAAEAIDDLQRLDYAQLGHCSTPSPPYPSGVRAVDIVPLSGAPCLGAAAEPCTPTSGTRPADTYTCRPDSVIEVTYTVRRFVVWNDPGQSDKRLVVHVSWADRVGPHSLVQQSVLRPPVQRRPEGTVAPTIVSATISPDPATIRTRNGVPSDGDSLSMSVSTTGLSGADKVYATLLTVTDEGTTGRGGIQLTSSGGTTWTGTLDASTAAAAGILLPKGSQRLVFTAERGADSRIASIVAPTSVRFCPADVDPTCAAGMPTLSTPTVTPAPATEAHQGARRLTNDPQISVVTSDVEAAGSVSFTVATTAGVVTLPMAPSSGCSTASCTWTGTLSQNTGYLFPAGTQRIYVAGVRADGTTGAALGDVTF